MKLHEPDNFVQACNKFWKAYSTYKKTNKKSLKIPTSDAVNEFQLDIHLSSVLLDEHSTCRFKMSFMSWYN
jgi:hypothetical protein